MVWHEGKATGTARNSMDAWMCILYTLQTTLLKKCHLKLSGLSRHHLDQQPVKILTNKIKDSDIREFCYLYVFSMKITKIVGQMWHQDGNLIQMDDLQPLRKQEVAQIECQW